tara:strand:- start:1464 stop:1661 length:198 start_codon:yes stop_codon:yes gene_type:complete
MPNQVNLQILNFNKSSDKTMFRPNMTQTVNQPVMGGVSTSNNRWNNMIKHCNSGRRGGCRACRFR